MKSGKILNSAIILSLLSGLIFLNAGLNALLYEHGWSSSSLGISLMVASGLLTAISAIFLYTAPRQHLVWGLIIILSSWASAASLGTYNLAYISALSMIAAALGMIGGASGIACKRGEENKA